jgi:hypothetical protein
MSDLGIFGSRFMDSDNALREYNEALRYLMDHEHIRIDEEADEQVEKILNVVEPLSSRLEGDLPKSDVMSEGDLISRLQDRHPKNWPTYQNQIVELEAKLSSKEFEVNDEDIRILNDIGDALDTECERLFRRMHERG